ncbi:MAG: hypothetical protein ACLPYZ_06135, partial [Limisphaerales bacterium]
FWLSEQTNGAVLILILFLIVIVAFYGFRLRCVLGLGHCQTNRPKMRTEGAGHPVKNQSKAAKILTFLPARRVSGQTFIFRRMNELNNR